MKQKSPFPPGAFRRWSAGVLLVFVVSFTAACGGRPPAEVPLARLVAEQETYDGRTVVTEGTVIAVRDAEESQVYFVLQDPADNRVRILPDAAAAPYEDATVTVTGMFEFRDRSGRELTVENIERDGP